MLIWLLLFIHAVLLNSVIQIADLSPQEIAIIQYDSRELQDYWNTSAVWNQIYCFKHGHIFIYYGAREKCTYEKINLASPWCKVKAMLTADYEFPDVKLFLYMDSDAVIDKEFANTPLNVLVDTMQRKLNWNPDKKPIIFNQDGPCWWCNLISNIGYDVCLNAGTVVWFRHMMSRTILEQWWDASLDPYEGNPIKRKFRLKWPWEQDRQMAVYNRSAAYIQVASQPERLAMTLRAGINDWCLSHLPGSGCYISHYCANSYSKQVLKKLYAVQETSPINVLYLEDAQSFQNYYINKTIDGSLNEDLTMSRFSKKGKKIKKKLNRRR